MLVLLQHGIFIGLFDAQKKLTSSIRRSIVSTVMYNPQLFLYFFILEALLLHPPIGSEIKDHAAIEYQEASLYPEAIILYQEELKSLSHSEESRFLKMSTRFRLAQCLTATGKNEEALELLNENIELHYPKLQFEEAINIPKELITPLTDSIYSAALIQKSQNKLSDARELFSFYLKLDQLPTNSNDDEGSTPYVLPTYYNEALFEIGLIDFLNGKYVAAQQSFDRINTSTPQLQALVKLYMARISLIQKKPQHSLVLLNEASSLISSKDPLHFELNYLIGEGYFQSNLYQKAIQFFEQSLPRTDQDKCSWYSESMEKINLSLAQCYLNQAKSSNDLAAYTRAEEILSNGEIYLTPDTRTYATILHAEATPEYEERNRLYLNLERTVCPLPISWYMAYGLNDFEQGETLLRAGNKIESKTFFSNAALTFKRAFELFNSLNTPNAMTGEALKYQAIAISKLGDFNSINLAYNLIDDLIILHQSSWELMEHPDEALYLRGYFAALLGAHPNGQEEGHESILQYALIAEQSFHAAAKYPNSKFGEHALQYLGAMHYFRKDYSAADAAYHDLTLQYPQSSICGEAWYWMARCAEKQQLSNDIRDQRLRKVYEEYPNSPYAAEAYFSLYSYQNYLQGERQAIKHLQNFTIKYPNAPYLIEAYYLIGLDYKRDRKSADGKWLRKKNLNESIDAFQKVEACFESMYSSFINNPDKLHYYTTVRYRAILERAMANLAISAESQGAKRQIYLQYAISVFKQIVDEFEKGGSLYAKTLWNENPYPVIYQEGSYYLAKAYLMESEDNKAEEILKESIKRYQDNHIIHSHYLSLSYYELGKIAMDQKEFTIAIEKFKQADEAAKNISCTEKKLDIWIQQSLCYSGLMQYDQAILTLSKVVNDSAISSLRLKAMYLRAEVYELQQRPELARKQLESLAKKGDQNPWVLKAQEKLEQ